jgi:hypothetical protein
MNRGFFVLCIAGLMLGVEGYSVASGLASSRLLTWPAVLLGAGIRIGLLPYTWKLLRHTRQDGVAAWKELGVLIVLTAVVAFPSMAVQALLNAVGR